MYMNGQTNTILDDRKLAATVWFASLRDNICAQFEAIEDKYTGLPEIESGRFEQKKWHREGGGGGEISGCCPSRCSFGPESPDP
mgnify:CR=1 FL=1